MSDKERELVEYFIKIVEETPSLHEKWINPPIKITTWKYLLELDKRLEDIKIINEEHRVLNGKLREELEFEKATNKELLSTGADLENKLYEEQDKNKRLNNIIEKLDNYVIADQMFEFGNTREEAEQYLQELKGSDKEWYIKSILEIKKECIEYIKWKNK